MRPFTSFVQKVHLKAKHYGFLNFVLINFIVRAVQCTKSFNIVLVLLLKIWKNPLKSVHEIFCNAELCGILKIKRIISWNYDGIKNFHLAIPERIWPHFDKQSGTAGAASSLSRQEIKRTSFSNEVNDVDARVKFSRISYSLIISLQIFFFIQ